MTRQIFDKPWLRRPNQRWCEKARNICGDHCNFACRPTNYSEAAPEAEERIFLTSPGIILDGLAISGFFSSMFPVLKMILQIGALVGLMIGSVSGNSVGLQIDHGSPRDHAVVVDCCVDAHLDPVVCFDTRSPEHQDDQGCPDHPGEHHHHHICSCSSPHLFADALDFLKLSALNGECSKIGSECLLVPESPVLSEDKPPLI